MAIKLSLQDQQRLINLAESIGYTPDQVFQDHKLLRELATKERKEFAKIVRKVDPQRAAASMRDVEHEDRFDQFESRIEEKLDLKGVKAAKAEQDKQKTELAERYSPEQITEIEGTMTRYGISDWKAGAVLYANDHPESDPTLRPPAHSERPGATWEFPTTRGRDGKEMAFKDFAADPRTHSLNAAYNIITDFKNKNLSPALRR